MKKDYLRKVAFGMGVDETVPSDPLVWAQDQFNIVPDFVWEKKLPNLKEQRDRYGHWVYQDREVLRKKHKNDRLAYETEKDNLRKITGERFFESLELSVRHTTALASSSPAFERMWHFWGNFFAISEKDFLASFSTGVCDRNHKIKSGQIHEKRLGIPVKTKSQNHKSHKITITNFVIVICDFVIVICDL